ncbi:hypothetical protein [Budvicia aquatica]|uniref:hypothetical protein n=1 Tax=Budvicia aquatica TaxID=82979 RepID=UPI0020877FD7|nr:hypothetical protein [Budvicia aquatica]GKX53886.1 hypothetical protein SOASR029_41950 [Budvicia aquatica]
MKKIEIYSDMLWRALYYIRNIQTYSFIKKGFDKSCYLEAELLHDVVKSLPYEEITEHDVDFLNGHARYYLENASEKVCDNYMSHKRNIIKLFDLVPEKLKNKLEWHPSQLDENT